MCFTAAITCSLALWASQGFRWGARLHAPRGMKVAFMSDERITTFICWICGKPVPTRECTTDAIGHPVHENC
jgi:hypothetical protein